MKRKLLDCTLIGILAGMASMPSAAASADGGRATLPDVPLPHPMAGPDGGSGLACGAGGCSGTDGLVFRLRTRGREQPVTTGTGVHSPEHALQPDRRATIALEPPGRAVVRGRFTIDLPGGGVVWATEDPALGTPELSVSAPSMVPFDGRAVTRPVNFMVRGNYSAFIARMELAVFRATDSDLVAPLVRLDVPVAAVSRLEWDGALPPAERLRAGDELIYVLRAYDADGRVDETHPRRMYLVRPEEAERGRGRLRQAAERGHGVAMDDELAERQSLLDEAFAGNGLRYQNIPVHGSRVRLQGRNLPEGRGLRINGEPYPVDLERKFVAEYLMPVGRHRFEVALDGGPGEQAPAQVLEVDVSGRYFFGVGIADITVYENAASGAGRDIALAGRGGDILSDGRLAFYAKAKLGGRYLLTAHADTRDRPLRDLFDGFTSADPEDVFRRLDPDLYYPTHGDDSSTWRDVDTMGRFYLRLEWDRNEALWGNFATGLTGTEYAQYVRSLHGAALDWRSRAINPWGEAATQLRAFVSEAQTAPGHSEFLGTGGSLYYLRHTDVLPGSERVVLEVRDRTTGRVEHRIDLVAGTDYEIDALQGRILLSRPLAQITRQNLPGITRDAPLDGLEQRLIVDYEWVPSGFHADEVAAGLRARHWLGDHVGLGLTWVDENRAGEDYRLMAADVTLQAGKGTYLKLEHSRTESTAAPVFFSDNGGLDFARLNPDGMREGEASALEARINLRELGLSTHDWQLGGWWRRVDRGYSVSRFDTGQAVEEYGVETLARIGQAILQARHSRAGRGSDALEQTQVSGEWRLGEVQSVTAELRRVSEQRTGTEAGGTLGALRYSHRFGTALDIYGIVQATLDEDAGYASNDAYTLGARYSFADLSSLAVELVDGDRGEAATVQGEYRISAQHSVYGGYTHAARGAGYDPLFGHPRDGGWTLGQRWRLSQQVNLFNESQFLRSRQESGLAHTFGMDFYPAVGWNLGFTLSEAGLTRWAGGEVEREAVSVGGGRSSPTTDWQSRVEWRRDSGAEQRTQWVSTHRLSHRLSESWRVAARLNYADTDDRLDPAAGARFIEGNLGFAYRPWDDSRWGLFGRYTYLYDLATLGQEGGADYDQRTQVLSLEGVYRLDRHWELAARLARREGEVRFGRGAGAWFDSATSFAAAQLRYELRQRWHALAEYRWLDVDDGGVRSGWLLGVDRDINRHFRIGAGYNFTRFSDDLTDFDYDHRGWFVNFVGSY